MKEPEMALSVGYECTPIDDAEETTGRSLDVLDTTRHYEQFESDFDLQENLGLRRLRYHAMWDKVIASVNQNADTAEYDFSALEPIYNSIRTRGFVPTADLCHHKVPKKIPGGFANPAFPEFFKDFSLKFQANFPWVKNYSLINEPGVTSFFHSNGLWGKHKCTDVFLNMVEAIFETSQALCERDPAIKFFLTEPINHDVAQDEADPELNAHVKFVSNYARFAIDEILLGKVDENHQFFWHLLAEGAAPDRILSFSEKPPLVYQRDLDFYGHCFKIWFRGQNADEFCFKPNPSPPPLSEVISEYRRRLPGVKLGMGEVNCRGTIEERIKFWKKTLNECIKAGTASYCWWGLTDSDTWGNNNFTRFLTTAPADPVGIYTLTDDPMRGRLWKRNSNRFSELFAEFASGQLSAKEIPE